MGAMTTEIEIVFEALIQRVSTISEIQSIGRSGGRVLPMSNADGDIDVFIYCDSIPSVEQRKSALAGMEGCQTGVIGGGHWGTGDLTYINGIETWLMYFTAEEATKEVDSILNGEQQDKLDNYYYPTGRCAMLAGIDILFDRTGFLSSLKQRLSVYPEQLAKRLAEYHLEALKDTEDLERAVIRNDPLFYHFALDIALDHFLQALFAMNKMYFPSRKRSIEYIDKFARKPEKCEARLLEVVKFGGYSEGIKESFNIILVLAEELRRLNDRPAC